MGIIFETEKAAKILNEAVIKKRKKMYFIIK